MPNPAVVYEAVCSDLATLLKNDVARDTTMPGALEDTRDDFSMGHLWNRANWEQHRSQHRWLRFVGGWWRSHILRAILLPLAFFVSLAVAVLSINRVVWHVTGTFPLLRLPMTPLSLQAASIGLVLVFRTNQTNDRLREAQKQVAIMSAVEREILQMLLVHAPDEEAGVVGLVARYLAIFGYMLKAELRDANLDQYRSMAKFVLPDKDMEWLFKQEGLTTAIIFRLRALIGGLYNRGFLDKEAFKFIEDDLAKLGDICSAARRLTTFPIPPSYHRHGSRSIFLWLGALPFAIEGKGHSALENLCTIFITGFVVLGLDAIAIESEQPFDVLPLHEFALGMSTDVISVMQAWLRMPSLAAGGALTNGLTGEITNGSANGRIDGVSNGSGNGECAGEAAEAEAEGPKLRQRVRAVA